jgi:hypothetical protein
VGWDESAQKVSERGWGSTNNLQVEKVQVGRKYKSWIYLIVL